MAEQIFVKKGDTLEPVDERAFEREDDLQALSREAPWIAGQRSGMAPRYARKGSGRCT